MWVHLRPRLRSVLLHIAVVAVTVVALFPVVWMFLTSIKPKVQTFSIPPVWFFKPTLESYREVFLGGSSVTSMLPRPFTHYLNNSLIVSITVTVISVIIGSMACYSLTRLRFKGRDLLGFMIVGSRALPPVATLLPIFLMMRSLRLTDTLLALIIVYTSLNVPFTAWMLRGFFTSIPKELEEAALIDGCSRLGVLFRIVLPLVRPGMMATGIFSFTLAWNDLPFALLLTSTKAVTLPVVATFTRTEVGTLWGPMAAIGTMMIIPIGIFSLISQRWLIRGLTSGSVKG